MKKLNTLFGFIWLIIAVFSSEITLAWLFSADGVIAPGSLRIIRTFSCLFLIVGIISFLFRRYAIVTKLNLFVFSLLLAFSVLEMTLRKMPQQDAYEREIERQKIRTIDPYLHHALVPMTNAIVWWGAVPVRYFSNSLGYRDKSCRVVLPESTNDYRVLFAGDSFTESVGVSWENSFIQILGDMLKERSLDVEILNSGVSSYSPLLYYRRLEQFFEMGYSADLVVIMFDITDIFGEAVDLEHFTVFSENELDKKEAYRKKYLQDIVESKRNAEAYGKIYPVSIWYLNLVWQYLINNEHAWDRWLNEADGTYAWTEDNHYNKPWVIHGIERCKSWLHKSVELCQMNETPVIIVIYPQPAQLLSDIVPSRHQVIFNEFFETNGIISIDLFPTFHELRDWRPYFIRDLVKGDNHWNERGHQLVARSLEIPISSLVTNQAQ
jgi:hypothetical protein